MKQEIIYQIKPSDSILDVYKVFEKVSQEALPTGIAVLTNDNGEVIGTVSDGDLRRAILNGSKLNNPVEQIATPDPICFNEKLSYREILDQLPNELKKRGRKSQKYLGKIIIIDDDNKLKRVLDYHQLWEQKVATHRHIVVMGLGYVGLTLAAVFSEVGFLVSGVDPDENKISRLEKRDSYVHEPGINEILKEQIGKNFHPYRSIPEDCDVYVISVGTPVESKNGDKPKPNLKYIRIVSEQVGGKLKPGNLVILRSTVPIGTSQNVVLPLLEKKSGLKCGKDFHLAFAPERTAEGRALRELRELPQIIGGYNEDSMEATAALFRELTPNIVRVSSLEAAEMAKLVNNTFRDLIFSYANQTAQIASHFNIDVNEVIKAANLGYTRDPVPLPSPGVGGPCLTKDPYIFSDVANSLDISTTLFDLGRNINESMHSYIVEKLERQFLSLGKSLKDSKILICGLAFKGYPETGDIRNSSALEIYKQLKDKCPNISGHDPVAEKADIIAEGIESVDLFEGFEDIDAVLFLNNHPYYAKLDIYKMLRAMNENPIIFDGWNLFHADDIIKYKPCLYLGLSLVKSSIKIPQNSTQKNPVLT